MSEPISLDGAARALSGLFEPEDVVRVNDAILRIARVHGSGPWHQHADDELFLCWEGSVRIELDGRDAVTLSRGDVVVVPRGTQHRPVADEVAHLVLLERPDTKKFGD